MKCGAKIPERLQWGVWPHLGGRRVLPWSSNSWAKIWRSSTQSMCHYFLLPHLQRSDHEQERAGFSIWALVSVPGNLCITISANPPASPWDLGRIVILIWHIESQTGEVIFQRKGQNSGWSPGLSDSRGLFSIDTAVWCDGHLGALQSPSNGICSTPACPKVQCLGLPLAWQYSGQ